MQAWMKVEIEEEDFESLNLTLGVPLRLPCIVAS